MFHPSHIAYFDHGFRWENYAALTRSDYHTRHSQAFAILPFADLHTLLQVPLRNKRYGQKMHKQ
jgi:hypothetical protein